MAGARNVDYTDQEFLGILDKLADNEGWASSDEMAEQLGIVVRKVNGKPTHPAQNVGVRLGWMKKIGFVINAEKERGMWKITPRGRTFLEAKLTASQKSMLDKLKREESVEVMHALGRRFLANGKDDMTRTALRREFQYHTYNGQRVRKRR